MFVRLNLLDNSIVLRLTDPYEHLDDENLSDEDDEKPKKPKKTYEVEVDLDLNASQNSRKYFVDRKAAGVKQTKTLQSSEIALKNAQKVAQNKVKQVSLPVFY